MILNRISVPTKRKIVGVTLGLLGLSQIPVVDNTINSILNKTLVDPVTVGVVAGAVALVGAYLIIANEGI